MDGADLDEQIASFLRSRLEPEPEAKRASDASALIDMLIEQIGQVAAQAGSNVDAHISRALQSAIELHQVAFAVSVPYAIRRLVVVCDLLREQLSATTLQDAERCCLQICLGQFLLFLEPHHANGEELLHEAQTCISEVREQTPSLAGSVYLAFVDIQRLLRLSSVKNRLQYANEALTLCNHAMESAGDSSVILLQLKAAILRELATAGVDRENNLAEAFQIQASLLLPLSDDEEPTIPEMEQIVNWFATEHLVHSLMPESAPEDAPFEGVQLLERAKKQLPKSSFAYLKALNTQARLLEVLAERDPENAISHLDQAYAVQEEQLGLAAGPIRANTLLALATLDWKIALQDVDPAVRLERAWDRCRMVRRMVPETSSEHIQILILQGMICLMQAVMSTDRVRFEEAIEFFSWAVKHASDSRNDWNTFTVASLYASLLVEFNRKLEAHAAYVIALDALERMRIYMQFDLQRMKLVERFGSLYSDIVELCLSQAQIESEGGVLTGIWCEEAWRWAEAGKTRSLRDLLKSVDVTLETEAQRDAHDRWDTARKAVSDLINRDPSQYHPEGVSDSASVPDEVRLQWAAEQHQSAMAGACMEEQAARRELLRLAPDAGFLLCAPSPSPYVMSQRLKQLIRTPGKGAGAAERTLLVEFFLLKPGSDFMRYAVFLLPLWQPDLSDRLPLRVAICEVSEESHMTGLVAYLLALAASRSEKGEWRDAWNSPEMLEAMLEYFPEGWTGEELQKQLSLSPLSDSERLRAAILNEIPDYLGQIFFIPWQQHLDELQPAELILVCNEYLNLLPMHIAALSSSEWLIDRYPLAYLPSAAMAAELLQMRSRRPLSSEQPLALIMGPPGQDLHNAAREAVNTATILRKHGRFDVVIEQHDGMRIQALRAHASGKSLQWLHLVTHSQFNFEDPLESHIKFHDGELTVRQLLEDRELRRSPISLWYQGSCESALAAPNRADELLGFVRALMCAGAQCVVASLWSVDDYPASEFAFHFYGELAAGASRRRAYQQALVKTRGARRSDGRIRRTLNANPAACGPFVLLGDAWCD